MTIIKEGSKWMGGSGMVFRVLHTVKVEDHTWVHYIKDNAPEDDEREYSCYLESFTSRFSPLPDDR
jgi:hypothetical protein